MLTHPTHERLITLGLTGMAKPWKSSADYRISMPCHSRSA